MSRSQWDALRVFVYGTLKCGHHNHGLLCRGYASLTPGLARGRVVDRPEGYPTLFVPPEDRLALGSAELSDDVARLHTLEDDALASWAGDATPARRRALNPSGPWRMVHGEVFTFHDGAARLRILDELEDFIPGGASVYCRWVIPVRTRVGVLPCWAYVSPHTARFAAAPPPAMQRSPR